MRADELFALIKSGTTDFRKHDIDGTFINENLSGLHFEQCCFVADFSGANLTKTVFDKCNLKTCNFSYCNLDDSSFENNCLDATEFKFVQFRNLTFNNNSAYWCDFSSNLLEDMRFTNYPGFHIAEIKAGWFGIQLADRVKYIIVTASDYLCNDAPYEFLSAINDLCIVNPNNTYKTKWLCWDEEPGAYIWRLERQNDIIIVSVYTSKRDSCDIGPEDRLRLEAEEINSVVFETSGDFLGFIKEVAESFEKIRQLEIGDKYYKKEWGIFPDAEIDKLKSFIQTIMKKRI